MHIWQHGALGAPGLNSVAPGLKEKLLAKGLSFDDAELAELGVGGWPPAGAAASLPAAGASASDGTTSGGGAVAPAADGPILLLVLGGGGDGAEAASASGVAYSDGDSAVSEAEVEDGGFPPSWLNVRSFSRRPSRLSRVGHHQSPCSWQLHHHIQESIVAAGAQTGRRHTAPEDHMHASEMLTRAWPCRRPRGP